MTVLEASLKIDWAKYKPRRTLLWRLLGAWAALNIFTALSLYALSFSGFDDAIIGGDFTVFHAAAKTAANGDAANLYDKALLGERLYTDYGIEKNAGMSWQYPPSYLLLLLPFAAFPYFVSLAVWSIGSAAAFYGAARTIIRDRLILFAMIAGPAAYSALITGQNGFFAALLLLAACMTPKSRPILAGVAAGLLTVKPHLGILIPLAYLAAGYWRAFGAAALTAIFLALVSAALFGSDSWRAFFQAIFEVNGNLETGLMPLAKMTTPFSAALFAGAAPVAAYAVFMAFLAMSAAFVWQAWRYLEDDYLRGGALISCVFMASPYGFYYELIILTIPGAVIAAHGLKYGWLKYERIGLAAAYILPMGATFMATFRHGVSAGFIASAIIFALTARRAIVAAPQIHPFKRGGALSWRR